MGAGLAGAVRAWVSGFQSLERSLSFNCQLPLAVGHRFEPVVSYCAFAVHLVDLKTVTFSFTRLPLIYHRG